jgi:hypothetical protein
VMINPIVAKQLMAKDRRNMAFSWIPGELG